MDNYSAHKTLEVRSWLEEHPRFNVHFTPPSGSWLNLVEVWFVAKEGQAIRRGASASVENPDTMIQ